MLVTKQTIKVKKQPPPPPPTPWGASYLGKSCDTGTFISAVAALVQTSVVALVCWCTSAVLRSEKYHRMTHQVAFLSFKQRENTHAVDYKEKELSMQSQKHT